MNFELYSDVLIIFKCSNLYYIWFFKGANGLLSMASSSNFDDAEADILEIVHESETPVLDGIEPVWTSD